MLQKHSLVLSGHASSVTLEPEFWEQFKLIARREGVSINQLAARIDQDRDGNLSSAVRVFVLNDLIRRLPPE